jgi:hypothetical protein
MLGLGEGVGDRRAGRLQADLGAVDRDRERLGGADLEREAVQRDAARARGRQHQALLTQVQLLQRLVDVERGDPDGLAHAVDHELELAAAAQGDLVAVLDLGVGGGHQRVVLADGEVGGRQRVGHGVAAEVDRGDLTVERELDGLAGHGPGDGAGEERDEQQCLEHQGGRAAQHREGAAGGGGEGGAEGHGTPNDRGQGQCLPGRRRAVRVPPPGRRPVRSARVRGGARYRRL